MNTQKHRLHARQIRLVENTTSKRSSLSSRPEDIRIHSPRYLSFNFWHHPLYWKTVFWLTVIFLGVLTGWMLSGESLAGFLVGWIGWMTN